MSNPLIPPEILDHIVDNLHDESDALQDCCLAAKSWIPRTRKHLFADIKFSSPECLESWKKTFPDPSNSPAYHTYILSVECPQAVTMADAEEGGWVRAFSRVVQLEVDSSLDSLGDSEVSLAPFHALSPVLRSLRLFSITLPLSRIFGLVRSLPLLEDLSLIVYGIPNNDDLDTGGPPIGISPPNSPVFTGTLRLVLSDGMGPTVRRLLDLPNGLHFRQLTLAWLREDELEWINALVAECSDTLESINASRSWGGGSTRSSIDLSRATRLRDARFECGDLSAKWIIVALQTVTSKHGALRQIGICIYGLILNDPGADIRQMVGDAVYGEWLDLDRLLVRFSELRSIRLKFRYDGMSADREKETINCSSYLLPEMTKRGMIDLEV